MKIVDRKEQILRHRVKHYAKVQWSNHAKREATWKLQEEARRKYPQLRRPRYVKFRGLYVNRLNKERNVGPMKF